MSQASDHDELIARIYAVAADPSQLLSLRPVLTQLADGGTLAFDGERLSFHFEHADAILSGTGRAGGDASTDGEAHDILLDERLRLRTATAAIRDASPGHVLPERIWLPDRAQEDRTILKRVAAGEMEQAVIGLLLSPDSDRPTPHLARRPKSERAMIELCPVPLRWQAQSAAHFAQAFSLTPAEQAILREVLERGSLRLLAQERQTSLGTVRNQLKRMLHKLELGSQGELIALYGGFRGLAGMQAEASGGAARRHASRTFLLDEVETRVNFYGHADGVPVLFFHPLFGGPFLPPATAAAFEEAGLRVVAPWRPHCGRTTDEGGGDDMAIAFAGRMAHLLDQLGIGRVRVLAAAGGTAFALAFARDFPHLCERVVIAGPALPISTDEELAMLGIGHRLPLQLARRLPAAMRLYVRAVVAKIRKGLDANYLDAFFKDVAPDHAFAAQPDNREFLRDASLAIFEHGFEAAIEELKLYASDWSALARDVEPPVVILRGAEDRLASDALSRSFADRFGFELAGSIADAGSFLLFQKPADVADILKR
jgi:pimeloyl-ACP methyl ester carboxylesterase/DNA-binding CsgD family transcriptional regulator